jgi:hypothetical protein
LRDDSVVLKADNPDFPDLSGRPLDFAFRLYPIRLAGLWVEAVVPRNVDERQVIDDAATIALAGDTVFIRLSRISRGAPPNASDAATWQRSTLARFWCSTSGLNIPFLPYPGLRGMHGEP